MKTESGLHVFPKYHYSFVHAGELTIYHTIFLTRYHINLITVHRETLGEEYRWHNDF